MRRNLSIWKWQKSIWCVRLYSASSCRTVAHIHKRSNGGLKRMMQKEQTNSKKHRVKHTVVSWVVAVAMICGMVGMLTPSAQVHPGRTTIWIR